MKINVKIKNNKVSDKNFQCFKIILSANWF